MKTVTALVVLVLVRVISCDFVGRFAVLDVEKQNGEQTTPDIYYHLFLNSYAAHCVAAKGRTKIQAGAVSYGLNQEGPEVG